jgi:hypothetical protein
MAIIIPRPLSRRTLLHGAGVCVALPFLEAMRPRRASAQELSPQRFVVWFMPNGTDPGRFFPAEGNLSEDGLSECLEDWKTPGFAAEGEWEASTGPVWQDMTLVRDLDHQLVCEKEIHNPAMALSAHTAGGATPEIPPSPTLDQYLADRIQGETPYRSLTLYATGDTAITQGFLSFRENGQTESVYRDPAEVFDMLFAAGDVGEGTADLARQRRQSILDWVGEEATSLNNRLGAADRQRVDQYLQSVFELEQQLASSGASCTTPPAPESRPDLHTRIKQFRDLAIVALQCDLTRVVALQYSNSWDVNFGKYALTDGVGEWSDHFLSHKLDDQDRATDLDGLAREEAMAIANARVVQTSRFKMRRFANLVNALRAAPTASGTLLDESLVMFTSENGDGDSHSRLNIPIVLAGGVGGFQGGRVVSAGGQPTGALHASILNYFGIETTSYGDPAAGPIAGL